MASKYQLKVTLADGETVTLEKAYRDDTGAQEAVRRIYQNNGFWNGDRFHAAGTIYHIDKEVVGAATDADLGVTRNVGE